MALQLQGTITTWNDEKGYGFISPLSGTHRIFVHIKQIKRRHQRPQVGQKVYYSPSKDKQGRPCAANVSYAGKQKESAQGMGQKIAVLIFATLFFTALAVLTWITQTTPDFLIALYALASAVTFIAYANDKSAARNGRWRTAEATLHTMALLGGWPGALLAQKLLRHKSVKAEFQWIFRITVVLNLAVTIWLLTPNGPELTQAFLEKLL